MKLNKLIITNFKGIKELVFEPNGRNAEIRGDNATRKSSIFDAYCWLLTGKDSNNKADFQIKPVTKDGQSIHNLETEVEANVSIDSQEITLKKRFQEKWTKKRGGKAITEFTGHTTDYFIDEVPILKKDFDLKLKSLFDPAIFQLVSGPFYFNSLRWEEQRRILMEICGCKSDAEEIKDNPIYVDLKNILNGATVDDHKKKTNAQRKKINKELDQIPVRISELSHHSQVPEIDPDEKAGLNAQLRNAIEGVRSLENNTAISEKQIKINGIVANIIKVKASAPDVSKDKEKVRVEIEKLQDDYRETERKIKDLESSIKQWTKRVELSRGAMDALRKDWKRENAARPTIKEKCPTCNQSIPEDQIEKAKENFNKTKAEKLADINSQGKDHAEKVKAKEKDIKLSETVLSDALKALESLRSKIQKKTKELQAIKPKINIELIEKLKSEKVSILAEIDELKDGSSIQIKNTKNDIAAIEEKLKKIATDEAEIRASERTKKRIIELEKQEKELASEFERLEAELAMIDEFILARVSAVEGSINDKFSMATFKLFDTQVNGAIVECCETLFEGVPFNRGLNHGARINVGLDIIDTLSEHYGLRTTIIIDNAESVTKVLSTGAQMIKLVVDEKFPELEINIEN